MFFFFKDAKVQVTTVTLSLNLLTFGQGSTWTLHGLTEIFFLKHQQNNSIMKSMAFQPIRKKKNSKKPNLL